MAFTMYDEEHSNACLQVFHLPNMYVRIGQAHFSIWSVHVRASRLGRDYYAFTERGPTYHYALCLSSKSTYWNFEGAKHTVVGDLNQLLGLHTRSFSERRNYVHETDFLINLRFVPFRFAFRQFIAGHERLDAFNGIRTPSINLGC